jgi:hypothetical protein
MGYANTIVGIEEFSEGGGSAKETDKVYLDPDAIEHTDDWLWRWGNYAKPATVQSVVCCWHKDELFCKLVEKGELDNLLSCHEREKFGKGHPWCGNCYKCFSIWAMAKALQIEVPIKMNPERIRIHKAEYVKWRMGQGADKFVSLGLYARLEEKYPHFRMLDL